MVLKKIMPQLLPQLQDSINAAVAEALNNEHPDDEITHAKGVGITVTGDAPDTKALLKYYDNKTGDAKKPSAKQLQTIVTNHAESVADGTLAKKYMNPNVIAAIPDIMAKGSHFRNIPPINLKKK